jgi:hypothetical protein
MDLIQYIRPADRKDALRRAQIGAWMTSFGAMCTLNLWIYRKIVPEMSEFYKRLQENISLPSNKFPLQGKINSIILGGQGMIILLGVVYGLYTTFQILKEAGEDFDKGVLPYAFWGMCQGTAYCFFGLVLSVEPPFPMLKETVAARILLYLLPGIRYRVLLGACVVATGVGACLWRTAFLTPAPKIENNNNTEPLN